MLAAEGKKPKILEILTRAFEATNVIKDAEALFEDAQPQGGGVLPNEGQINQGGVAGPAGGVPPQGAMPAQGMGGGNPPQTGASGQIGGGGPPQL